MARKLYYKILDNGGNKILPDQWEEVLRLEHWYNSEFLWTAGKLAFKQYAVFPNFDHFFINEDELWKKIVERKNELRGRGYNEEEIVNFLESENLIIAKKGGYFDGCLASGFTGVAANEWNAYLVCEFLLRCSRIVDTASIMVEDEGNFIKTKRAQFIRGAVVLESPDARNAALYSAMIEHRHVFSIVDPEKYDQFPSFQSTISDFNALELDEQRLILKDWNWLGFDNNFDRDGDDVRGTDLNKKVKSFRIAIGDSLAK
ncbi:MAG TPA: hypothetical protein VKS81_10185 [Bacteroidota bacterium]|nr:hypothetical protein [Bacteroidota bacterium]